jgi:hypothetical protein
MWGSFLFAVFILVNHKHQSNWELKYKKQLRNFGYDL